MDLPRNGREFYDIAISASQDLDGTWEASFTGLNGDWKDGTLTTAGTWAWLVAGPGFDAAAVNMNPADTQATINDETDVLVRLKEDPVLTLRHAPPIRLVD